MAVEYQAACLDALITEVNNNKKMFKDAYVSVAKMLKRMHWEAGDHGLKKVTRADGFTMWVCARHALEDCYTINVENVGAKPASDAPQPSRLVSQLTRVDSDSRTAPLCVPGLVPVRVLAESFRAPVRTAVNPLSPFMAVPPAAKLSSRAAAAWDDLRVSKDGDVLPKKAPKSKPWFYAVATKRASASQRGDDTLDSRVTNMCVCVCVCCAVCVYVGGGGGVCCLLLCGAEDVCGCARGCFVAHPLSPRPSSVVLTFFVLVLLLLSSLGSVVSFCFLPGTPLWRTCGGKTASPTPSSATCRRPWLNGPPKRKQSTSKWSG